MFTVMLLGKVWMENKYWQQYILSKKSIRDRVTHDREPSIHAMQSFFWSVVFVLDGDFLHLPKFVSMINGGSEEFRENGWHGMYVLSVKETNQRIYPLGMDFEIFKNHALQAAEQWQKRRQWFDSKWIASALWKNKRNEEKNIVAFISEITKIVRKMEISCI